MNLTLRYAALSDRGLVRDGNQDSVYAGPRLLAVADGMGGMAAGDIASQTVISAMFVLDEDLPGDDIVEALRNTVDVANQLLRDKVAANPELEGMGTTLTAMLFSGSRAGMVHIGDSRAYLLRDGELTQITKDDTYVQMLVDEQKLSLEEAGSHPQRSLLTKAMDGRDIKPEYQVRPVLPDDRYLICSDGLSGVVSEQTIADTLREYVEPQQCVDRLVALALRGGGPDNITVIVADTSDEDIMEAAPIVAGAAAPKDRTGDAETVADGAPERESTPAARASALSPPPAGTGAEPAVPPGNGDDAGAPRRRPVRSAVLVALLLVLLGGGLWYGWSVIQSSYYVGVSDDGNVAVFQGVPGRVAGLELSRLHESSDRAVDDLLPHAQERVRQGIRAESEEDARQLMEDLIENQLKELCPPPPAPAKPNGDGLVQDPPKDQTDAAEPAAGLPTDQPDCRTD